MEKLSENKHQISYVSATEFRYVIPGSPTAWGAPRVSRKGSYSVHTPRKKEARWHLHLQHRGGLIEEPVILKFTFEIAMPLTFPSKKRKKVESGELIYHTKRPDLTNLQKFTEDCLVGIVLKDDNQVVKIISWKRYSMEPKTTIEITTI